MRLLLLFLTLFSSTVVIAGNYQYLYEHSKLGPFYCNISNANQDDPAAIITNCKYIEINGATNVAAVAEILNEAFVWPRPTSFTKYKTCEKAITVIVHSNNKNVKISCHAGQNGRPQF